MDKLLENYYTPDMVNQMVLDTKNISEKRIIENLSTSISSTQNANILSNEVEFWKWMARNWDKKGMFNNNQSMLDYMAQGDGKVTWMRRQIQGKGYEWDFMTQERYKLKNLFKIYDAGDVPNRPGSDVTELDLLTGKSKEYQMKAYTSNNKPDLKNTSKDITVVSNKEKIPGIEKEGYSTQTFKDAKQITKDTDARMNSIKDKTVNTNYNLNNVSQVAGKAGLIGALIGIGTETLKSYKRYKSGELSGEQYFEEITKSGLQQGVDGGATAVIMLPVTSVVTAAGASALITFPVGVIVSAGVDYIVSPALGRGKYAKLLNEAIVYKEIDQAYYDLSKAMAISAVSYKCCIEEMQRQSKTYDFLKEESIELDKDIRNIIDNI